jgi:hypothetical protein
LDETDCLAVGGVSIYVHTRKENEAALGQLQSMDVVLGGDHRQGKF